MEQKEITKTRLIIYVLMAYGLTCLMGILMWYGSTKGYDLTVLATTGVLIVLALLSVFLPVNDLNIAGRG